MKKRILGLVLIFCMLFSLAVVPARAAIVDSGTCGENLTWTLDDEGTLTISRTGEIENGAFSCCGSLTSISISSGVTRI